MFPVGYLFCPVIPNCKELVTRINRRDDCRVCSVSQHITRWHSGPSAINQESELWQVTSCLLASVFTYVKRDGK